MLYRTHHPLFFPFISFTSISPHPRPSATPPPLHLLSSSTSIQVENGMDCVEGALKSSFKPDMAVKPTQQAFLDDILTVNGQSGISGDDFFVDDLLDFSKAGTEDGFVDEEQQEQEDKEGGSGSVFSHQQAQNDNADLSTSALSVKDGSGSVTHSELCVPADDVADLEWLSHFVDDSFSGCCLAYPAGKLAETPSEIRSQLEIPVSAKPCFTTPIQTKARSKRARTGGRIWTLGSPSLTESSTSSSSSSSCTSSSLASNFWLVQTGEWLFGKPPAKKQKRKRATETGGGSGALQPRRCSHCLVQKTPQWRTGPLGAKTLCNACGVRYKSGRLLPEYRPACSPTFSSDVHSNNHRKVLEMRRKKEVSDSCDSPVQSF